ncbi:MAG: hypothetical protein LBQ98_04265 [Nitrososphaerota archaeon]|nr:hypothetical protein [Nitrososphaerota archaeon]
MPILQKHKVIKFDKQPNKTQRYTCQNKDYTRTIFQLDYKYHTCEPETKFHILERPLNGSKVRNIAQVHPSAQTSSLKH